MGVLETVFRTRKFDLDDDVLMEFDDYFDKKSRNYNSFSLDEEDFISLQNFVEEIKSIDSNSVVYVSTYGYEITNSKGEKSTYADTLWIDTNLTISKIEEIMKKCAVAESSYVSVVGDNTESGKKNVWLIKQENAQVTKLTDQEKISQMIMLYWD